MALKIFKFVWFFSLLATVAIFLYVYASLPPEVSLQDGDKPTVMSREVLFYTMLGTIGLVNVLVFLVAKFFTEQQSDFKAWFYGWVTAVNLFTVTVINFLGVYNSGERFDYSNLGILIYGSIGLIALWSISWPVYVFYQKLVSKQTV